MSKTQTTTMLQNRQEFLSERERSSNLFNLLLLESRPIHRPCRERLPTLDRQSLTQVPDLAGCSTPCETRHSLLLLVSELLLLLESRPIRRPCRERLPTLDRQSYKRVAHLAGCSAPCETRHSLLVSGSQLHTKCQICYIKLKYVSKDHCILEQRQVKTP
jgi:hypothetical protein